MKCSKNCIATSQRGVGKGQMECGINAWIAIDGLLDIAGAGYGPENLFYRFMPNHLAACVGGFVCRAGPARRDIFATQFFAVFIFRKEGGSHYVDAYQSCP